MSFDPKRYVIKVQGNREYLPVSARLIWFRSEHPDWGIVTEAVEINHEKQFAVFRASIFNEEGRLIATATKKEDVKGFGDYIEKSECVPLSTKILTAEGWKTHDELRLGEAVLAYDTDSDSLRWAPLLAVRTYKEAPVVRLHNGKGFDVVCTPDHKWHVRYQVTAGNKVYRYQQMRETQRLTKATKLTVAAPGPTEAPAGAHLPVTPEQAFVMGMLITDGSIRYYPKHLRGYICQAKPDVVEVIRERLADVPHREDVVPAHTRTFPTGKTYDCRQGYRWHPTSGYLHELHAAFGITNETQLPHVVAHLTAEARKSLLEAMTLAESDKKGNFAQMPGRNDWVIDLWTALCALEGSMVCKSVVRESCGGIWIACRKKPRFVYASNLAQDDAGKLDVWCPQTPYGTWVARFDNDVVTITGNTGSVGRALAMCGYGAQFAPELEESGPRRGGASAGPRMAPPPPAPSNYGPPQRVAPAPQAPLRPAPTAMREELPPPFDEEEVAPRAAAPLQRPAPQRPQPPQPQMEALGDLPLRPASSLPPRPAPRPTPAEMAPPPQARPIPANAPIQRVREPERPTADPGGDEDLDDLDDPFADEDAPPPPPARGMARPPARPAPRKPGGDSLL